MITFNGVNLNSAVPGLRIGTIRRDILPPRVVNMIDVPARMGAYFLNVKNGVRTYTATISITGISLEDIRFKVRDLAEILNTDGLASLVFADESYKTYMAIAVENTELDEKEVLAKGSITFLIPDSVGKGATVSSNLGASGQVHSIVNNANSPAFPIFKVDFNADAQFFSMISPDGFVLIGNPAGVTEITKKPLEMVLNDKAEDLTPWSSAGAQLDYEYAVNSGTMAVVSDTLGGGLKFKPSDYGDDAANAGKWHGPAIRRSLPSQIQDFRIELSIELRSSDLETGRIEFVFFNASNVALGKMVLWDRYPKSELNTGHIYAGNIQDQHTLIASMGPKKYDWNQFFGKLNIRREGNQWEASIVQTDYSGRYKYGTHLYKRGFLNLFNDPIASIQVHISKYGSTPAADMSVRDIRIQRINQVLIEEVPTLFEAGDQLIIDHEKGACFLNGRFFNQHLDPASKFFKLIPGTTQVTSRTTDEANTTIQAEFMERWI
ncbi:phage tail family protein [Bacillus sp. ISL-47]|uniref:distal tail protein Dit n=1 Tax=Bacillus sp. ISL-47 TaxID=2819130 RepID=UPI001BEAA07B|nr:distal tail protein Dit [Bacillus sp. ISL-47]MBT2688255.1 phage tail family protein [Bacillus sp. ISL-47]MBT2710048.1 phage tail family protein [Pseudomonas sp. ISL-84]